MGGVGAMSGPPLKSNSRVEPRVAQIDQHVDDDEDRRVEQHQVLDDDDVALDHGGDERASEPGHPERLLDRHRSAQHEAQQHARDGDHRQERVRQRGAEHDQALPQSLCARRPGEVRATPSGTLLGLNALRIPTGSPTNQEITRASSPISALIGPRWAISSATVSPRKNDLPRRPAAMSTSHRPYWTGRGSDSPRSAMIRTRSSFDIRAWPSTPRMATSGSPGRIR